MVQLTINQHSGSNNGLVSGDKPWHSRITLFYQVKKQTNKQSSHFITEYNTHRWSFWNSAYDRNDRVSSPSTTYSSHHELFQVSCDSSHWVHSHEKLIQINRQHAWWCLGETLVCIIRKSQENVQYRGTNYTCTWFKLRSIWEVKIQMYIESDRSFISPHGRIPNKHEFIKLVFHI